MEPESACTDVESFISYSVLFRFCPLLTSPFALPQQQQQKTGNARLRLAWPAFKTQQPSSARASSTSVLPGMPLCRSHVRVGDCRGRACVLATVSRRGSRRRGCYSRGVGAVSHAGKPEDLCEDKVGWREGGRRSLRGAQWYSRFACLN